MTGNSGAISLYKKTLKIDPEDIDALTGIGRVLYHLHNYTGAINYLDKSLAIDPINTYAVDVEGLASYKLGRSYRNEFRVFLFVALTICYYCLSSE